MRPCHRLATRALFVCVVVATPLLQAVAANVVYDITDLSIQGKYIRPAALNDAGHVLVWVNDQKEMLWFGGALTALADPPGYGERGVVSPEVLNDKGHVAGYFVWQHPTKGYARPILWVAGKPKLLDMPAGYEDCYIKDLTDGGTLVGFCLPKEKDPRPRPTLWLGGKPRLLSLPSGMRYGWAYQAAAGKVYGVCSPTAEDTGRQVTVWDSERWAPKVLPNPEGTTELYLVGASNDGTVLGSVQVRGHSTTCLWRGGVPRLLPEVIGARGIDGSGRIFGVRDLGVRDSGGVPTYSPTVWSADGKSCDLNSLLAPESAGWVVKNVESVSPGGRFIGEATDPAGKERPILATPRAVAEQ